MKGRRTFLHHAKRHCGIKESTAYPIENPGRDSERKAKAKANEKKLVDCGRSIGVYRIWTTMSSQCLMHSDQADPQADLKAEDLSEKGSV